MINVNKQNTARRGHGKPGFLARVSSLFQIQIQNESEEMRISGLKTAYQYKKRIS